MPLTVASTPVIRNKGKHNKHSTITKPAPRHKTGTAQSSTGTGSLVALVQCPPQPRQPQPTPSALGRLPTKPLARLPLPILPSLTTFFPLPLPSPPPSSPPPVSRIHLFSCLPSRDAAYPQADSATDKFLCFPDQASDLFVTGLVSSPRSICPGPSCFLFSCSAYTKATTNVVSRAEPPRQQESSSHPNRRQPLLLRPPRNRRQPLQASTNNLPPPLPALILSDPHVSRERIAPPPRPP